MSAKPDIKPPATPIKPSETDARPFRYTAIHYLQAIQKYTAFPVAIFVMIHLFVFVIVPAFFGTEAGDEALVASRKFYQTPVTEPILLGSMVAHAVSGVLVRIIRKRITRKDAPATAPKAASKETPAKKAPTSTDLKEFYRKYLNLTPMTLTGYVLIIMMMGHVLTNRISALVISGDSSLVGMAYIAYAVTHEVKIKFILPLLALVGTFHTLAGCNMYLKLRGKKWRQVAKWTAYMLSGISMLSLARIAEVPPVPKELGNLYESYLNKFH